MSYRYLVLVTLAAASAIASARVGMRRDREVHGGGDVRSEHAGRSRAPRGAIPDLQGVWRYESAIAFERPAELEGRELLTDEEVAQKEQAEQEQAGEPAGRARGRGRGPPLHR